VAQNIVSAAYKRVGWKGCVRAGWGGRGVWWAQFTFQTIGPGCVPKELSMVPKPHYKAKQAI